MAEIDVSKLQELIDGSSNIVFFGGAGVSTESGIKDFRSVDGLYNQKYDYPPETMLSHTFFVRHKEEFFRFYNDKLLEKTVGTDTVERALPNKAHYKLAELEKAGKLKAVITQNIDGLHQEAGSRVVYELHGSVLRNYCEKCGKSFDVHYMFNSNGIPKCDSCGGDIKPDVVLYEEGLDNNVISGAVNAIKNADMLIIGGTSLVVYPAAGLIDYYRGDKLVLINKDATARDSVADYSIHGKIGEILGQIVVR
ncbi:MAG: NAD-dependent protein deacylase [Lachnospiraceae bacterium]|nr:NAD-dependent protein deacylase [Lachnospiraceae bacterium]